MPLLSWQKWWIRTPSRRPAVPKTRFRKFFLESLEERVLLSNTYTVNLGGDAGVSTGQFSGDIRYCITQADLPANIGSTIKFTNNTSVGSVITLSTNELEISQNMTIVGPGAKNLTIDGGTKGSGTSGGVTNGVRVFNITSQNAVVSISGLTINNGDANPANNLKFAGNQGGNIFNSGNLTLTNDVVSNGISFGIIGAPPGRGGGIFNARNATLTLDGTVITGNVAVGLPAQGGGIFSDTGSALNITGLSSITNNVTQSDFGASGVNGITPAKGPGGPGVTGVSVAGVGGAGGGIYSTGDSLTITGTDKNPIVISGNNANGDHGGNGGNGGNAAGAPTGDFTGFHGGTGAAAGAGSDGLGGGIYVATGTVTLDHIQLTGNIAQGGNGGNGGNGGKAGAGGASGPGGLGGAAGASGAAGNGRGGGLYSVSGDAFTITNSLLSGNQAIGGNAGVAGNGGLGGAGGGPAHGGNGGLAGGSAIGGDVQGGGIYNGGAAMTITGTQFTSNQAVSGTGGTGGNGGAAGSSGTQTKPTNATEIGGNGANGASGSRAGQAWGGAIFNQGGDLNIGSVAAPVTFTSNVAKTAVGGGGGAAGAGGLGQALGGNGGIGGNAGGSTFAYGGAIAVTVGNLNVNSSTFSATGGGNQVVAGAGGAGGAGGTGGPGGNSPSTAGPGGNGGTGGAGGTGGGGSYAYGGAISLTVGAGNLSLQGDTISGSLDASGAGGIGGVGGAGGIGGNHFGFGGNGGNGGVGGTAGAAGGGAVAYFVQNGGSGTSDTVSLTGNTISNNRVLGGTGGAGAVGGIKGIPGDRLKNTPFSPPYGVAGISGGGGSAQDSAGGGFYIADDREAANASFSANTLTGNVVQSGQGGLGAVGASPPVGVPRLPGTGTGVISGIGANGGLGGTAEGGGVAFVNNAGAVQGLSFSGDLLSNNKVTGGTGGGGGNAGSSGSISIAGGTGGPGGQGSGAGVYTLASALSVNNVALSGATVSGNIVTGGTGGLGGAGFEAPGGVGGLGTGGGVYSTSLNANKVSTLTLNGNTLINNQAVGGVGGAAGSGTTPNGGNGGQGGIGGNGEGGALFGGDDSVFNIYNNEFGGFSGTTTFGNSVSGGLGGRGGNAGTPAAKPSNNGGNGGNGGNGNGGAVFIHSGTANFFNDTIIENQAIVGGLGGAPGGGAGLTGKAGTPGTIGAGFAGGYYAFGAAGSSGSPTVNNIGNTILDLNSANTNPDVQGAFNSLGYNLLGSTAGATGFVGTDQTGIAQAQLNMGPLQNNGGTVLSNALLAGSIAIDAGKATLPPGDPTDQRGTGFVRTYGSSTDVGAFEYQLPTITGFSPDHVLRGAADFSLTITGTGFMPGATVSFGGVTLTPTATGPGSLTVTVPAASVAQGGQIPVTVTVPDGSGVAGNTLTGPAANFPVVTPSSVTVNNPGNQTNNEGDPVDLILTSNDAFATNWTATGLPPGLSIPDATTGEITGTIGAYAAGTYTVMVSATDNGVTGSTTFTWTVNAATPPTLTSPGNPTVAAGSSVQLAINAVHADPGTFSATGLPPGLSINPNTGLITGTIPGNAGGDYNVTVSASRGGIVGSTSFVFTVTGGGVAGLGFFTLGFGTEFPLPPPGQSAGLFGLALEEFALTLSPMLANILAFMGQPNTQVKDQIPQLLNAIDHDPLHGTPLGSMAEFLGYQAAINVLAGL